MSINTDFSLLFFNILYTGILKENLTLFNHLKLSIKGETPLFPFSIYPFVEFGYIKKADSLDFVVGSGFDVIFLKNFGLSFGYNRIGISSVEKNKFSFGFFIKGAKRLEYGVEENMLAFLKDIKITLPPYVEIETPFYITLYFEGMDGRPYEDIEVELGLKTKKLIKRFKINGAKNGEKKIAIALKNKDEIGDNFLQIFLKDGRTFVAPFKVYSKGEKPKYSPLEPYAKLLKPKRFPTRFEIRLPERIFLTEKFLCEIRVISNLEDIYEEYEGEILVYVSNHEKIEPERIIFTKRDRGVKSVYFYYPGKGKINIILKDKENPELMGISPSIEIIEKEVEIVKKEEVRPVEKKKVERVPEVKPVETKKVEKVSQEEIENMIKEGTKKFIKGEYEEAFRIFSKVLEYDPENKKAREYIEKVKKRIKK